MLDQVFASCTAFALFGCKPGCMVCLLRLLLVLITRFSGSRRDLLLENLALRQQLTTLKRKHPRPRVAVSDKLFWVLLRRVWPEWKQALIFVQPETVVRWHGAGFKLYWEWLSRHRAQAGRKCVSVELRELTFRMVAENPTWGAPRIHGELRMLGFDISERTVLRWMGKATRSPEPARQWATFLSNHREAIAAMHFFTVPTLTFGVLYCFFVIAHDRLKRLMKEYVRYYHEDRTHLTLEKSTPTGRHGAKNPDGGSRVVSRPRLGGLHHRYDLAA